MNDVDTYLVKAGIELSSLNLVCIKPHDNTFLCHRSFIRGELPSWRDVVSLTSHLDTERMVTSKLLITLPLTVSFTFRLSIAGEARLGSPY